MDKNIILKALPELRKSKKNFKQAVDLIVVLRNLDLKKPDQHVDFFQDLHFSRGRKIKVCALVGAELREEAKKVCDTVVLLDDFVKYQKDKKMAKKLADDHDFFIAQANIMAKVASAFGKILGTRGKMPNPKAGCVVPPKASLKPLYDRLQKVVRVKVKTQLMYQTSIGNEEQPDEEIADNFMTLYNALIHHLPGEENNIKSAFIKLTMSKPIKVK